MHDIKALRESYGLSRAQFSKLFSIPARTVFSWEAGERSCPVYVFSMINDLLEVKRLSGALESERGGISNEERTT